MIPWNELKTEYVTSQISFKALAEKHGISYATLYEHARIDHWADERRLHTRQTVRKSLDKIGDQQAENLAKVDALADELLQKLGKAIDELEMTVTRYREKGEDEDGRKWQKDYERMEPGGVVDRKGLQQLAASLRDLKQIKALQSELDQLEQEARIQRLKKDSQEEGTALRVVLEGELEEFGE